MAQFVINVRMGYSTALENLHRELLWPFLSSIQALIHVIINISNGLTSQSSYILQVRIFYKNQQKTLHIFLRFTFKRPNDFNISFASLCQRPGYVKSMDHSPELFKNKKSRSPGTSELNLEHSCFHILNCHIHCTFRRC